MTYRLIKRNQEYVRVADVCCASWVISPSGQLRLVTGSDGLLWGLVYGQLTLAGRYQS